ncbi:MAG: hypothetical protein KDA22_09630 [Phycisphaerales bacterium]|nr:hypothetical protein [Phycisphaerales bacterium]
MTTFGRFFGFSMMLGVLVLAGTASAQSDFIRGDANDDASIDIADPVATLELLFVSGTTNCFDALDSNDDGGVDIADAVFSLSFLFSGGASPSAPFPDCGPDPTADSLDCVATSCPGGAPCFENADCPAGFYCEKAIGDCDGMGVCTEIPAACPAIFDPVCGCDGNTYDNACVAAASLVSVAFEGECLPPGACFDNADCDPGFFCLKAVGDCDGIGVCTPMPLICTLIFDPVCGCDGMTYSNECVAWGAGVSVADPNPCP